MTIVSGLKVAMADLRVNDTSTHPLTKDDAPDSIKKQRKRKKKGIVSTNTNLKRKLAFGPRKLRAQPQTLNTSVTTVCGPQHI